MKRTLTLLFSLISLISVGQNCIPNTNSIVFDGSSTYINTSTSNLLDITDSITIEAWINSNAWGITSAEGSIVCKHGWSAGEAGYVLRAGGNGILSFNMAGDSSGVLTGWKEVVSDTGTLHLNVWYHVAATFDGANMKLYVNGVLKKTKVFHGTIVSSTFKVKLGRLADINQPGSVSPRFWSGKMDEVRIWHRALTQSEISANMNRHVDPIAVTGLVGYWRFNEGSGTTVADLGAGNNSGVLVTGAWSTLVPFTGGPVTPIITQNGQNLFSNSPTGNQWNLNGLPIQGETGTSIIPGQNGSFTVTVTDINGCSATSAPFNVTTLGIIGTEAQSIFSSMIYDGKILRFNTSPDILKEASLNILDVKGEIIINIPAGSLKLQTDLGYLSAGVYLLSLSQNNYNFTKRIVVSD
jgi:hypothetical protein